jgi:hypothetical protein
VNTQREAQHRMLSWLAIHGQAKVDGGLLEQAELAIESGELDGATPDVGELMTEAEHTAVELAGKLWTHIVTKVIGRGHTRQADVREVTTLVHHIQRAVMAQAAARAYPDRYRRLGDVLGEPVPVARDEAAPWQLAPTPDDIAAVMEELHPDGQVPAGSPVVELIYSILAREIAAARIHIRTALADQNPNGKGS